MSTSVAPAQPSPTPDSFHVVLVRLGSPQATPERADPFLRQFEVWLSSAEACKGKKVRAHIANTEKSALAAIRDHTADLVIVPPSLWARHLAGQAEGEIPTAFGSFDVCATIGRAGVARDQLVLVTPKNRALNSLEALTGKAVHIHPGTDLEWLRFAVFPKGFDPSRKFRLVRSRDLADDFFLLADEPENAASPAALLLDRETCTFFAKDKELWSKVRLSWTSPELPTELLCVRYRKGTTESGRRGALTEFFITANDDDRGRILLRTMGSDGFRHPDHQLVQRTLQRYRKRSNTGKKPTSRPSKSKQDAGH